MDNKVGVVSAIIPEKSFGFIVVDGEGEYFFHSTAVSGIEFEDLAPGDKVQFIEVIGGKGKRAVGVKKV